MKNGKKRIYIVDDDEMLTLMLEDHLQNTGETNISSFTTGEDCLKALKTLREDPDLIILDFNLDSIEPTAANGIEILKAIKSYNRGIMVIMYSSQKQYGIALQTIAKGALEYVIKDENAFRNISEIVARL
jgi:two-component system OmpR family response regulator